MKEPSRSYVTEEQIKRRSQDPKKQSNINFRQSLRKYSCGYVEDLRGDVARNLFAHVIFSL